MSQVPKKFYLIALACTCLLILIALVIPYSQIESWELSQQNTVPLAFTEEVIGKVELFPELGTSSILLRSSSPITNGDAVVTHNDSKALFAFSPKFWLMPHSKMQFLQTQEGIVGHLIYGQLKQLSESNVLPGHASIRLFHDGNLIEGTNFSSQQENQITGLEPLDDKDLESLSGEKTSPQNMIEKQIFETLNLYKHFFQTCLVKSYKETKGTITGGETVFSLLIQPNGDIEKVKITKNSVKKKNYQDCLISVLDRIQFKNLKIDEPLYALFPLNMELPAQ